MTNLEFIRSYIDAMISCGQYPDKKNNNGSMLVRDRVLYSYGDHFPMLAFSEDGKDIYFNITKFSRTTSNQQRLIRSLLKPEDRRGHSLYECETDGMRKHIGDTKRPGSYNGWTNWETWTASLWLNNDEWTYKAALKMPNAKAVKDFYKESCSLADEEGITFGDHRDYDAVNWQEIYDGLHS